MRSSGTVIIEKHIGVIEFNRQKIDNEIKNAVDFYFFNDFSIFYGIMVMCGGVPMRILLVEDEKRMAQALCEILRLEKYEVDHYANGIDGLAEI